MATTIPSYFSKLNPELEEILEKGGVAAKLFGAIPIPELRDRFRAAKIASNEIYRKQHPGSGAVTEQEQHIIMRDGFTGVVRIYQPRDTPADGSPLFVMYHGGGYCLGGLENEHINCQNLCETFGFVVVNASYRLAPEYTFPTGFNDSYDILKWVASNVESFNVNPKKGFIVGGVSSGATSTIAASHLYRDEKLSPPLTGLYLSAPALAFDAVPDKYKHEYTSYTDCRDAPIMNTEDLSLLLRDLNPDFKNPLISPFRYPSGHRNLPPSYFQIAGLDPLRDGAIIYEKILREEYSIKTRVDIYPGLPHSFWTYFPQASFSKKYSEDMLHGVAWLLKQGRAESNV